jgi:hypothetical protein
MFWAIVQKDFLRGNGNTKDHPHREPALISARGTLPLNYGNVSSMLQVGFDLCVNGFCSTDKFRTEKERPATSTPAAFLDELDIILEEVLFNHV